MGNFELRFACRAADGSPATPLVRIIAATSHAWAMRIGSAMQEEQIASDRWIARLDTVIPTERENAMQETLHGTTATWGRVLLMLNIPFDAVKWFYTHDIGLTFIRHGSAVHAGQPHEPKICGFRLWPDREDGDGESH